MKQKGFTIPELLVAVAIFLVVMGGAINMLVTGIGIQKKVFAAQEVMDQTSFLAEYMSRRLRGAQKDLGPTCLLTRGLNYEITHDGEGIKFLNNGSQCHEFFLDEGRIKEVIEPGGEQFLSSDNLLVAAMNFVVLGASQDDNLQPRVSFTLDIQGGKDPYKAGIQLQTTISQRKVDVPN